MAARHDFGAKLEAALTAYLKGELEAREQRIGSLEHELRQSHQRLSRSARRTTPRPPRGGAPRRRARAADAAGEHARGGVDEPRGGGSLPTAIRASCSRSSSGASSTRTRRRRDRLARDKLAAELDGERAEHAIARQQLEMGAKDMASRSMEFGEKEYYQVTVGHLQELQRAKDDEMAEAAAAHASRLEASEERSANLASELDELRKQRQTMALSLAQYATLEAEWEKEREASGAASRKLAKENKALRKKASKVASLERAVAESSHEDLTRMRREAQHVEARLQLATEQLTSVTTGKAESGGVRRAQGGEGRQRVARERAVCRARRRVPKVCALKHNRAASSPRGSIGTSAAATRRVALRHPAAGRAAHCARWHHAPASLPRVAAAAAAARAVVEEGAASGDAAAAAARTPTSRQNC